jgi:hypothetical protein
LWKTQKKPRKSKNPIKKQKRHTSIEKIFVVKVKYQELNWMQQFHPKLGWRD